MIIVILWLIVSKIDIAAVTIVTKPTFAFQGSTSQEQYSSALYHESEGEWWSDQYQYFTVGAIDQVFLFDRGMERRILLTS